MLQKIIILVNSRGSVFLAMLRHLDVRLALRLWNLVDEGYESLQPATVGKDSLPRCLVHYAGIELRRLALIRQLGFSEL